MGMNYRIVAKTLFHFEQGETVSADALEKSGVNIENAIYLGNIAPAFDYDSPKKSRSKSNESE